MRFAAVLTLLAVGLLTQDPLRLEAQGDLRTLEPTDDHALFPAQSYVRVRMHDDVAALQASRPAYPFWRHIFTVPDGAVIFGAAADGRLLATFPLRGDWTLDGVWE